jgi:hypothetical protein
MILHDAPISAQSVSVNAAECFGATWPGGCGFHAGCALEQREPCTTPDARVLGLV